MYLLCVGRVELRQTLEEDVGVKSFPLCREGGTVAVLRNISHTDGSLVLIIDYAVTVEILVNKVPRPGSEVVSYPVGLANVSSVQYPPS